jgi:amidase
MVIDQSGNYSHVFSRYQEPVAYVNPGDEVTLFTEEALSGQITSSKDSPSQVLAGYPNPQVGPIYINDAQPGDTLVVDIMDIEPTRDWAMSFIKADGGGLVPTEFTRMLNDPLPERVWIYKFTENGMLKCTDNEHLCFPWEPFLGCIATSPELEVISTTRPFEQGGNMDVPDVKPGNRIYLPVKVQGAYFYTGDCHAKQGDGELCGTALEITAKVRLRFGLIKQKMIRWPRIESKSELMVVGSARPMEDAARIAYIELIEWMTEYGWDRLDAYQALTQVGKLHVGNMVSSIHSVVAKVAKSVAILK